MCGKKCSFCGKDGVKLWQGMIHESVLVCASCAEKRQLKKQVCEYKWVEEDGGYKDKWMDKISFKNLAKHQDNFSRLINDAWNNTIRIC